MDRLLGVAIVDVAAGASHSVCLAEVGVVFTCGQGFDGRLGHGTVSNELEPRAVEKGDLAKAVVVTRIAAGGAHTVCCGAGGELITFGCGGVGALGHGSSRPGQSAASNELVPRQVQALRFEFIQAVAAGAMHTIVLAQQGRIFSFGYGLDGALGHGSLRHEPLPRQLEDFGEDDTALGVAAGVSVSLIWTARNLYTFGDLRSGALGHTGQAAAVELGFEKETRPKLVAALKGKRIAGATSSSYHSAAWTTDGEVWSFGHKKAGIALGHAGVVGDPGGEEVPRLILHHL